jgi:hypothetical protein
VTAALTINNTFWAILVTEKLQIPAGDLAIYSFARSLVMLAFFFGITPWLGRLPFKHPMLLGFGCFILSQLVLITIPELSYFLLLVSICLEACSLASLSPLVDKMMVVTVDPVERARIVAIIYVIVFLATSPFGWIAGQLSEINRNLPFLLNIVLFLLGAWLAVRASSVPSQTSQPVGMSSEA